MNQTNLEWVQRLQLSQQARFSKDVQGLTDF